jgi:hypothetical protein
MMWIPLIALTLALTAPGLMVQAAPSAEAEALGVRLAQTGTLAALLPTITAKEREDMVAAHPELSDADKAALRATADELAKAASDRLTAAIGHGYASRLSVEDLRALVAFNESAPAQHWRKATPGAVMEAMQSVGEMHLTEETEAAFCKKTGKLCDQ